MNIARYKWPVIIAAGLHGALFLSFPAPGGAIPKPPPVKVDHGPPLPTIEVDVREPEDEPASGKAAGSVTPLPTISEVPMPNTLLDPFTMPMVERTLPDKPVPDLKHPWPPVGPVDESGPHGPGGPLVATPIDLDRIPRAVAQGAPEYPYSLRQMGVDGSVTVEFVVGTDGLVLGAEAVRWSRREFADAAVKAVLRWKFEPGTINGRKVRFRMAVPVEFNAAHEPR